MYDKSKIKKFLLVRELEKKRINRALWKSRSELGQQQSFTSQLDQYALDYSSTKIEKAKVKVSAMTLQSLDAFGARLRATSVAQKAALVTLQTRVESLIIQAKSIGKKIGEAERLMRDADKAEAAGIELRESIEYQDQMAVRKTKKN
jgi:uncharacterized Rmd1/YagE family protein